MAAVQQQDINMLGRQGQSHNNISDSRTKRNIQFFLCEAPDPQYRKKLDRYLHWGTCCKYRLQCSLSSIVTSNNHV